MSTAPVTTATDPLLSDRTAAARPPAAPRPTPQATIGAVMWTVRERGLKALGEPANQERLSRCDAAARGEINAKIEKLLAADRIPGGTIDA